MVFERTARKREEAAAAAALQATKPVFQKVEKGLDYLRSSMEEQRVALNDWEEQSDIRQAIMQGQIEAIIDDAHSKEKAANSEKLKVKADVAEIAERMMQLGREYSSQCSCGATLSPLQIVCHECGLIHDAFPYDVQQLANQDAIQDAVTKELLVLSDTIRAKREVSSEYTYQEELKNEIFTMETLLSVVQTYRATHENASPTYRYIEERIRVFLKACKTNRIELAIIGNVKAGKSSLINALLGGKMASVDATPETSVLVKYRTTPKGNYIKATFYTERQWAKLWETVEENSVFQKSYQESGAEQLKDGFLGRKPHYETCTQEELSNLIMKWTSSQSPEHFFVRELEVGYEGDTFPHDVVLVDTPGLRDPVKYRSNITKKYIGKSDWALACIACENLSSQGEFDFLGRILSCNGQRPDRVVVVATKADMLDSSDCKKKQNLFLQQVAPLYEGEGQAVDHFVSTSAEIHTLLTEYLAGRVQPGTEDMKRFRKMLTEFEIYDLSEIAGHTDDIYQFAGINRLFEKVDKLVLRGRRKALKADLEQKYQETISYVLQKAAPAIGTAEQDIYEQMSGILDIQQQRQALTEGLNDIQNTQKELLETITELQKVLGEGREEG